MWAEIVGETGYRVSDQAEVISQRKTLSQWTDERGRRRVKIKGRPRDVHLLVLHAFVGPRPEGAIPMWLNGNVTDNRAENLCWYLDLDSQPVEFDRCRSGHEYTPENTEVWGSKNRICRACRLGVEPVVELPEVLK
ncbi:hypothetical protein UI24_04270 [Mycobacteroides franklinii]|nr:hypothetical protein [Mycobacteroides franklinii]